MSSLPDPTDEPAEAILRLLEMASAPGGHIDPEILALIRLGGASSAELQGVRAHIVSCPPCRRKVSEALKALAEAKRSVTEDVTAEEIARPKPQAKVLPIWRRWAASPPYRLASAAAVLLVASTLFAIYANWEGRTLREVPLYFSLMRHSIRGVDAVPEGVEPGPEPRPRPAIDDPRDSLYISLDASGTAAVVPGETFSLHVGSDADGEAVVVRITADGWKIAAKAELHAPSREPVSEVDFATNRLYPLTSQPVEAEYVVIATDSITTPLSQTVESLLPTNEARSPTIDAWKTALLAELKSAGHRWAAVERFRTIPAKNAGRP
jgi:hypothetical protein